MRLGERVYRSLLVAYPRNHRQKYGEPMAQLVRDRLRDEGGGFATAVVWSRIVGDLVTTAFAERTEATVNELKREWWTVAGGGIASISALLGFGNLFDTTDGGPFYGKVVAFAVAAAMAATIFAGLWIRRRNRVRGSYLIGFGTLPASLLVLFFWFPPVGLIGVLAFVVAVKAIIDGGRTSESAPLDAVG